MHSWRSIVVMKTTTLLKKKKRKIFNTIINQRFNRLRITMKRTCRKFWNTCSFSTLRPSSRLACFFFFFFP
jgi:hypothetical protein